MKSGFTSGIIAGFFAGIVTVFSQIILAMIGLFPAIILEILPFTATVHIGYNTIWAAVFGIVFARFYDVILGKGVKKGLVYGLILYLLTGLWPASYYVANWNPQASFIFTGFLFTFTYGILQGALYRPNEHSPEIGHNTRNIMIVGSIAGFIGGVVAFVLQFVTFIMGISYNWYWPHYPPITSITNLAVIEIILMIVWGAIFSIIFLMFFGKIPGKGIMKGLYFGLLLSLLCAIRYAAWGIPYATPPETLAMSIITYSLAFISYGLVLGYLYKK